MNSVMHLEELRQFLIKAKKAGYAAGGESVVTTESDGSKSTRYEEGDFKFHDNYFGGEGRGAGGREVVWYTQKPCWIMVYYDIDTQKASGTIPMLLKALSNPPSELPVRGPNYLEDGEYAYKNSWQGTIDKFIGEETITYQGKEVYKGNYQGGLVDQKEG